MKVSKVVDPKLVGMGLGVFAATFISAQMVDYLDDQPAVGEYAREIAGAVLTVGGSLLMGTKDTKTLGLAMGAAGVSTVASGIVRRLMGKPASQKGNGGVTPTDLFGRNSDLYLASVPVANGRGAFTLA